MTLLRNDLITAACVALITGMLYALSCDIGPIGPLMLIAPIPILVYALRCKRPWLIFATSFLARLLGSSAFLYAYVQALPVPILLLATMWISLQFAAIVMLCRWLANRLPSWIASLSFPVIVTAAEFVTQLISPHGSFGATGYSLIDIPVLVQIASIGSVVMVSFITALVPAVIAMIVAKPEHWRTILPIGLIPLVATLLFGAWRLSLPYSQQVTIGLASIDSLIMRAVSDNSGSTQVNQAYAALLDSLNNQQLEAIVLPERMFANKPADHEALSMLQSTANKLNTRLIAGFDDVSDSGLHENTAKLFQPAAESKSYTKQRLIPGLEGDLHAGNRPLLFSNRGIAICKDFDFPDVIRVYGQSNPRLLYVPAWDFRRDGKLHSRMAVMRGIENGFAVARAAANGRLTLSDPFGRVVAEKETTESPTVLIASVGLLQGSTLYVRFGDFFGWIIVLSTTLVICWAAMRSSSV